MNFTNPWGFIALLAIPLIIILYILKQKYKPQEISSMALWNKILQQSDGYKWKQKLKNNILMVLQILIALFLAFALSRPFLQGAGTAYNKIIIIDTSTSMQAIDSTNNNITRLEQAKKDAISLIENSTNETSFTVIVFDDEPYIATNSTNDKSIAIKNVNSISYEHTTTNLEALNSLLRITNANSTANVYLFTDKNTSIDVENPNINIYGENNVNYAVKQVGENNGLLLVKVASYGGGESCTVSVFNDGVIVDSSNVTFKDSEFEDIVFDLKEETYNKLTVKITTADALEVDNTFYFVKDEAIKGKALLLTNGNIFLEKAISLIDVVELYKKDLTEIENLTGYDIYIFDGMLPDVLPTDGHIFAIDPQSNNSLIELSTETAIESTYISKEILNENISSLNFIADTINTLTVPLWGNEFIGSNGGTLGVYGEKDGQKICVLSFDLHKTQLPLLKEFPILIYNIITNMVPKGGENQKQFFAGEEMILTLLPKTINATLLTPTNKETSVSNGLELVSTENQLGFYSLTETFSDSTFLTTYFAVNPVTDGESNLEIGVSVEGETNNKGIKTGKNLMPILILIGLIMLIIEWWVKHKND